MTNIHENIIIDPQNGVPRLRGLQVPVQQVLDLLSTGITEQQILMLYPGLKLEDIKACQAYAVTHPKSENSLEQIIRELEKSSWWFNASGYLLFAISIVLGVCLYLDIRDKTIEHIREFLTYDPNTKESVYPRLIYLVIRSSALGVITTTVVVFCIKTAVACFDQSARFLKRRNAALFLKHLFDIFSNDKLEENVKIQDVRRFFESWNQTVESAFSTVKVDKKGTGSMEVNLTKDGAMFKSDDREK